MRLSQNFTLEEFTITNTGFLNIPSMKHKEKLLYLSLYILQPIANNFGRIKILSGYRSPEVNASVKGSPSSQHLFGEAADFLLLEWSLYHDVDLKQKEMQKVFDWIILKSDIKFGQCIFECIKNKIWIHISLPRIDKVNQQALLYDGIEYKPY